MLLLKLGECNTVIPFLFFILQLFYVSPLLSTAEVADNYK